MINEVDVQNRVAVYMQIENNLQFAITSGRLAPGERLPSVRELSERLEVNPNTVAKAYRDLEVMGMVRTRRGRGVYVREDAPGRCKRRCLPMVMAHVFEAVSEAKAAGYDKESIRSLVQSAYSIEGSPYSRPPTSYPRKKKAKK